jgi:transcription antitermination factor NusG
MTWYCVRTEPKLESRAQFSIQRLGYLTFCPQILVEIKQRAHAPWKRTSRLMPLFNSYIFTNFELDEVVLKWPRIIRLPGVVRILSATVIDGLPRPLPLADDLIEALRMVSNASTQTPQAVSLAIPTGTQVRITEGPFTDLTGIVSWSNEQRVQLLLNILGGERPVEVLRQFAEVV